MRDPTGLASMTTYNGWMISNWSHTYPIQHRTVGFHIIQIHFATDSDFSWTNVDDLITWTITNFELIRSSIRTTSIYLFSTCRCKKCYILLSRRVSAVELSTLFSQEARPGNTNTNNKIRQQTQRHKHQDHRQNNYHKWGIICVWLSKINSHPVLHTVVYIGLGYTFLCQISVNGNK